VHLLRIQHEGTRWGVVREGLQGSSC
jgi:hypothetical protein